MKIVYSKTREQFPLSTKKIIKKTISGVLLCLILPIVWGIIFVFATGSSGQSALNYLDLGNLKAVYILLGYIILCFVLTYIYQRWYFSTYFYELTSEFIQIKKGPITPLEVTVPYERIQDIYVDQDLLDRIFGLYDVHISSATAYSGVTAHIDGVEKEAANGLRELLLETVREKISKNGK